MIRIAQALAVASLLGCGAQAALGASTDPMTYTFTTPAYDTIFDDYITPLRYTEAMNIEMSVTIDTPLAPNMDNVSISPMAWSYDDGVYSELDSDTGRFNGRVSTNALGEITEFLMQVYLDAPLTPGVWVRRNADGDAYATAFAQEVVTGLLDPCWRHSTCDPVPQTRWAQDRATGYGSIAVNAQSGDLMSSGFAAAANVSSVPVPAPIALLLAGVLALGAFRQRPE